jgi:hypothetical protein
MKRNQLHVEPKSVYFHSNNIFSDNRDRMFYAHMFLEDLGNSIMPIGGKRFTGKPFSISVSPDNEQPRTRINILFPSENNSYESHYSTIEETVSGFIEDCAKNLIINGPQHYEIAPVSTNPEISASDIELCPPMFTLINISGKIIKIGNIFIQLIPSSLWRRVKKKYIILPRNSVWQISIPKRIGGDKDVRGMLKGLFIAGGKYQTQTKIIERGLIRQLNFDTSAYFRGVDAYVAWFTKSWGWDIRSGLQRYTLDYYQFYRRIMFSYALAIFREHIFGRMNLLLGQIGYESQMKLNGLPSSSDIFALFIRLKNKELSFKEVIDLTETN